MHVASIGGEIKPIPAQFKSWNEGPNHLDPQKIEAGQTIKVFTEIDWTMPYIEKNFSISIWAIYKRVIILESSGKATARWYLYSPKTSSYN